MAHVPANLTEIAVNAAAEWPAQGFSFRQGDRIVERLSYQDLDLAARRLAGSLLAAGLRRGQRALLVYPSGLEFLRAFWACVYAGVVVVPAAPPHPLRLRRTLPRLLRIARDCQAQAVLTHSDLTSLPGDLAPLLVVTDRCQLGDDVLAPVAAEPAEVAVLQYTSGSTREPRGVVLTHANLLHNLGMLAEFHGCRPAMVMVHWLPLFHDMGLIRGMLSPVQMGADTVLLDPMEFAQRPIRWLRALSEHRATITGAPDFGYALTARKVQPKDLEGLDLTALQIAFCSAEPIRPQSLRGFARLCQPCGFRVEALKPSYGLAEATVMVCAETGEAFRTRQVSRAHLARGQVSAPQGPEDGLELVNCGRPLGGQELLVVDPQGRPCPWEVVGEIWLRGPCVAAGYWGREEDVFAGYLASGQGPYLRTGDLGWLEPDGSLTVCGRLKDLIILRGQNYYPQDIEAIVQDAVPELRPGCGAAFSGPDGGVVVVWEAETADDSLVTRMWSAVGEELGIALSEVVVIEPGRLSKTASGKVQRQAVRGQHERGELEPLLTWKAPDRPTGP